MIITYEKYLTNELIPVSATYGLNAANTIQTKISFLGMLNLIQKL